MYSQRLQSPQATTFRFSRNDLRREASRERGSQDGDEVAVRGGISRENGPLYSDVMCRNAESPRDNKDEISYVPESTLGNQEAVMRSLGHIQYVSEYLDAAVRNLHEVNRPSRHDGHHPAAPGW